MIQTMTAVDNKNAPSKFTNGTQLILMKNGIKTSIDQALAGLKEFDYKNYNNIKNNLPERIFMIIQKMQWYSIDCSKKNVSALDDRWFKLVRLTQESSPLGGAALGLCLKLSEGFDRISVLFDKVNNIEREKRFQSLKDILRKSSQLSFYVLNSC